MLAPPHGDTRCLARASGDPRLLGVDDQVHVQLVPFSRQSDRAIAQVRASGMSGKAVGEPNPRPKDPLAAIIHLYRKAFEI